MSDAWWQSRDVTSTYAKKQTPITTDSEPRSRAESGCRTVQCMSFLQRLAKSMIDLARFARGKVRVGSRMANGRTHRGDLRRFKPILYSQPCFVVKQLVERVGIGLHKSTALACQLAVIVICPAPLCNQLHHTKSLSGAGCNERY